jgi:ethanolamine ammonia-lyase small subunit
MSHEPARPDPWQRLRRHTPARIALGRAGSSLPTSECLRFAAAHALARDAVHLPLDTALLIADLAKQGWPACMAVQSQAATRDIYLRRPDLGRRLDPAGPAALQLAAGPFDLSIILADGLSAAAAQRHAPPLLQALKAHLPSDWMLAPLVVATQARVALGDEIGALLQSRLTLVLIGERPGLSSPDSLGAYLTFEPAPGRTDAERNCVSNIRPDGLPPVLAARRIAWLLGEALHRRLSGIALKDESAALPTSALPER